jgi:predicted membrane protein
LRGAGSLAQTPGVRVPAPAPHDAALAAVPPERRMLAIVGEARRVGRWVVPQCLRVRAILGEVKVDLRESPIPDGFTLDVTAVGSRVTLIVPPGVTVAFDVLAVLGNAINQAHETATPGSASPAVRVTGSAVLGEVRVLVRERPA